MGADDPVFTGGIDLGRSKIGIELLRHDVGHHSQSWIPLDVAKVDREQGRPWLGRPDSLNNLPQRHELSRPGPAHSQVSRDKAGLPSDGIETVAPDTNVRSPTVRSPAALSPRFLRLRPLGLAGWAAINADNFRRRHQRLAADVGDQDVLVTEGHLPELRAELITDRVGGIEPDEIDRLGADGGQKPLERLLEGGLVLTGVGHGIKRAELILVDDQHHQTGLPAIHRGHDDRCHHGDDEQNRQQQRQEH